MERKMDVKDIWALLKVVGLPGKDVDFYMCLHGLLRQGFITHGKYETLLEILNNAALPTTNRYKACVREITQCMTLQNIVSVFNDIGLQDTAQTILNERYCEPAKQLTGSPCHNNDLIDKLHFLLDQKRMYKNSHVNIMVDFQNMTIYFMSKLNQTKEIRNRQRCLDCLSIVVRMRGFILETKSENEAILEELMSVKQSHKDLDHTVTTAVYLISKVYIARLTNSVDEGEAYLVDVKQLCHHYDSNLLRTLIIFAEQALYRKLYADTSEPTFKHKSLSACDTALYSIANSSSVNKSRWNVFLQMSQVFTLLKIQGMDFSITKELNQSDIESAKSILRLITPRYSEIGNRYKAMYHICMARVYNKENTKLALSNSLIAMELEKSAYLTQLEKQTLESFTVHLSQQQHQNSVSRAKLCFK